MKSTAKLSKVVFLFLMSCSLFGLANKQPHTLSVTKKNPENKVFNIKDYGAIGDGKTLNTIAINKAITACVNNGGGTVLVPAGRYSSGTILLKSNVTLYLENEATILGTADLKQYKSYKMGAEDPNQPINITVKDSAAWCRALVLLDHVENVTITGTGTIDGAAVIDKNGEEGRRGPHGIFVGDSKNISISNIRVTRSGNYNIVCLGVTHARFTGLTITEGSDGIHIRKGKDLVIENCKFYTGDDAIAGGYWKNMLISDCLINSSCNGIRLILPATNLEIRDCQISGPGVFGHHRGPENDPLVTNSLTGIILQPGAWGLGAGKLDSVYIHDVRIRDVQTALTMVLNKGNQGGDIRVEKVVATGISENACSVEGWPEGSKYQNVKFKDITVSYVINDDQLLKTAGLKRPGTESRPLPYWGFYTHNVKNITFENVNLNINSKQTRPLMGFDQVENAVFKNVNYTEAGSAPVKYIKR